MAERKRLALLLAAAALLVGVAVEGRADLPCVCSGRPTVLEEYERAGVVIIARVVSIDKPKEDAAADAQAEELAEAEGEKGQEDEDDGPGEAEESEGVGVGMTVPTENYFSSLSIRMVVERSYKGHLKPGDEMIFANGGRCDRIFFEGDVGRRILFYLPAPGKDQKFWSAGGCGRDGGIEHAADDLLFLNNLGKAHGRTRLSGTLAFKSREGMGVANRTIRVVGAKKTYEVKTDEHGVYEIYDLPAGRYFVEPETPPGWKVVASRVGRSSSVAGGGGEGGHVGRAAKGFTVSVDDKRHAGLDIRFDIDNAVGGKVYNAAGKPMRGVCLRLYPAADEQRAAFPYKAACTEADGAFLLEEIPTGSYVLVVNEDGKITSSEPFGKFYYPNVAERERAAVITVGPGDRATGLDIHPPAAIETITVEGRFLYSDGRPVVGESVEFKPEKDAGDVEGGAKTHSDTAGRFSLNILKGLKGQLHGQMGVYYGKFDNCPKLEAFLKQIARDYVVKTPALALRADADLRNVELRYPFPSCQKEPDQE